MMLFIMRGTTLSGKDTFVEQHFKAGAVLSSDMFRELLTGDVHNQHMNKVVFDTLYSIMESRFSSRVKYTVLNATNLRISDCSKAIELCKKYRVPFTFISILPPKLDELHRRNIKRNNEKGILIPDSVIDKHLNRYESAKAPFLEEAKNNSLCCFIEIDQDYKVVQNV